MYENIQMELEEIVKAHLLSDYKMHKGSILLLLKELARRMILWSNAIKEKEIVFDLGNNILFDVVHIITGHQVEPIQFINFIKNDQKIILSHFDILMFSSYLNWVSHKDLIRDLGFDFPNPYDPYLKLFKRGGRFLKYEYTRLEVYPFLGINVHPIEKFLVKTPFYNSEEDLELADKNI